MRTGIDVDKTAPPSLFFKTIGTSKKGRRWLIGEASTAMTTSFRPHISHLDTSGNVEGLPNGAIWTAFIDDLRTHAVHVR
jgi:hypothetical protein